MRIAFISTMAAYSWGGSEELWSQAALRLLEKGFQVGASVLMHAERHKRLDELEKMGCNLLRRRPNKSLYSMGPTKRLINRLLPSRFQFRPANLDYAWLDAFRPDLVVISQGANIDGLDWMQRCIVRGLRYIVISHAAASDFWPSDYDAANLRDSFEKALACYFVSRANLELTRFQLASLISRARIIRNPYSVSYDAAPPWPSTSAELRLACVGRLDPGAKGQDILFDVLSREKWRGRKLEVALYGVGKNEKSLVNLKQMLNLGNVTFSGFVQDVESIWAQNHGLILPSRYEGLPLAIVEAMLCGRACVVTDVGGNAELIRDNVTGFVAVAPKAGCLDDAMERAWSRRTQIREVGRLAAQSIRQLLPKDPVGVFVEEIINL